MTNPSHKHLDKQKGTKNPRKALVWMVTILFAFAAAVWLVAWLNGGE